MSETRLKVSVQKYLKSIGAYSMKISDRFSSGWPDLTVIHRGRVFFIELKTPTGIVSPMQKYVLGQITQAGGNAYVCRTLQEVKHVVG